MQNSVFLSKNYQFLGWRLGTGLCMSPPKLETSPVFPIFLKSYIRSVSREASRVTSLWYYNKFVILDTNVRFNCGESDLFWNIAKFQNIMTRILAFTPVSDNFKSTLDKVVWNTDRDLIKSLTLESEVAIENIYRYSEMSIWWVSKQFWSKTLRNGATIN